eukprot:6868578-Alexandrium_andersonii.AAC.1
MQQMQQMRPTQRADAVLADAADAAGSRQQAAGRRQRAASRQQRRRAQLDWRSTRLACGVQAERRVAQQAVWLGNTCNLATNRRGRRT